MLVTPKSTDFFAKAEAGGKGYNLFLMTKAGLNVPSWVVIGQRYFKQFLKEQKIENSLALFILAYSRSEISAEATEKQILDLFLKTGASQILNQVVDKADAILNMSGSISIRSSAADEDSHAHSFAGLLSSSLYVEGRADVIEHIKRVWASAFSARSLIYRQENNLDFNRISLAVILQEMIDADKSGVLFTCNPVEKKIDEYLVSAAYGVGEGLVSGAVDADSFWIDARSGNLLKSELASKQERMIKLSSGCCHLVTNEEYQKKMSCLGAHDLIQIFRVGKKIHQYFRRPQDVEWAFKNDKLYILQTRPVKTIEKDLIGYPNLWDNSKIAESFGGKTLPLSFSFALRNYKAVYIQFCEVLGVSNDIIKDMESYLGQMLGSLHGRVYYNIYNWYKLVGVLPGFSKNREFMETMVNQNELLFEEATERVEPHPSWQTWKGKFRKISTAIKFIGYHFNIQTMVDDFLKSFHFDYDRYRKLPLKQMRGDELIHVYSEIDRKTLGHWKTPIINDFLYMIHVGLLRKLTQRWLKNSDITLQSDLLIDEGANEIAEPTLQAVALAKLAMADIGLQNLILNNPAEDCMELLNQSSYKDFYFEVLKYIDQFGFRCMSEMKLEEIDLTTDPTYLFVVLKNYLNNSQEVFAKVGREKELRQSAEKSVVENLRGIKLRVYNWVLKHARIVVRNRERTRFARIRVYSLARTIFQSIGDDLAALQIIEQSRDVFWLSVEEVMGIYGATLPSVNLKAQVQLRKQEYAQYNEEIDSQIFTRGAVYWNNKFIKEANNIKDEYARFDLKGLACSAGLVEGVVKVVTDSFSTLKLKGEILVISRTDPGWVPLYPSISGLLVEHGSMLAHSTIVARTMSIPTIVSIAGLTQKLKNGMRIRMDGSTGHIEILSEELDLKAVEDNQASINPKKTREHSVGIDLTI
jgi:pyruvate,water dikinase